MPPSPAIPRTRMFGARAFTSSPYNSCISSGGRWKRTHSPDAISPECIARLLGGAGASQTAHWAARKLTGAWHTLQCGNSLPLRLGPGDAGGCEVTVTGRGRTGRKVIRITTYGLHQPPPDGVTTDHDSTHPDTR